MILKRSSTSTSTGMPLMRFWSVSPRGAIASIRSKNLRGMMWGKTSILVVVMLDLRWPSHLWRLSAWGDPFRFPPNPPSLASRPITSIFECPELGRLTGEAELSPARGDALVHGPPNLGPLRELLD